MANYAAQSGFQAVQTNLNPALAQGPIQHAQVPQSYATPYQAYPVANPVNNYAYQPNNQAYQPPVAAPPANYVNKNNVYITHGVTSRPTRDNSRAYGSIQGDRTEYVLQNPVDPSCSCGKRMYYSKYVQYAEGLQHNIAQVQAQLRPRYAEIQAKLIRGKTISKYREFKFYLEKVLDLVQTAIDQLANLAVLAASPTQEAVTKLVNLINALIEIINQVPDVTTLSRLSNLASLGSGDAVAQFQLNFYSSLESNLVTLPQINDQLKNLYSYWISSLQAVFSSEDVTTSIETLRADLTKLVDFITEYYKAIDIPLEKPYGQVDAVEDLQKMQLDGKRIIGDLNQALFKQLGFERGCCTTTLADAARRGIIDEEIPPVNEEAAYTPSLWPHVV